MIILAEEKQQEATNQENEFYIGDLYPEQIRKICQICHIAANKRMSTKLECASIKTKGTYCRLIENIRTVFADQKKELDLSRKYLSAFMNGRSVMRKEELERLYDEKVEKGLPSFTEFLSFCQLMGIEVVGD